MTGLRTQLIPGLGIKKKKRQKQITRSHKCHIRKTPFTQVLKYIPHKQGIFVSGQEAAFNKQ